VFGLYAKSTRTNKPLGELYDSTILKLQAQSVLDCYKLLGVLHVCFLPVPGKLKDYIAVPLPNLYQALHTTVIGPDGKPVKVYIATKHMFELNSRGILAVGSPKAGMESATVSEKIKKLNKVFGMLKTFADSEEFLRFLTQESLSKTIFVFTPKGEAIELPFGSTPIDFAFKIHPWLGKRVWRVKVNGKFVGVDEKLESGNIVEIIPSSNVQLTESWMDLANTISTKQAISKILKQKRFQGKHPLDILVSAKDRPGLLSELSYVFGTEHVNISASVATFEIQKDSLVQFSIPPYSEERIRELLKRLRTVRGVKQIRLQRG